MNRTLSSLTVNTETDGETDSIASSATVGSIRDQEDNRSIASMVMYLPTLAPIQEEKQPDKM